MLKWMARQVSQVVDTARSVKSDRGTRDRTKKKDKGVRGELLLPARVL